MLRVWIKWCYMHVEDVDQWVHSLIIHYIVGAYEEPNNFFALSSVECYGQCKVLLYQCELCKYKYLCKCLSHNGIGCEKQQ